MKQTIGLNQFQDAFKNYNREDNFSKAGLRALFEYLEQYEEDIDQELELDVIALCCDYTEESLSVVLKEHNLESLQDLRDNTQVIMVDDESDEDPTIIYQVF